MILSLRVIIKGFIMMLSLRVIYQRFHHDVKFKSHLSKVHPKLSNLNVRCATHISSSYTMNTLMCDENTIHVVGSLNYFYM